MALAALVRVRLYVGVRLGAEIVISEQKAHTLDKFTKIYYHCTTYYTGYINIDTLILYH